MSLVVPTLQRISTIEHTNTKLITEVCHNIFDNIAFIFPHSTLFSKAGWASLSSCCVIFDNCI